MFYRYWWENIWWSLWWWSYETWYCSQMLMMTTQMSREKMCSRDHRFQDARQEMIRLVLHVLHKPFCLSFYSWESELLEFMLLKVHCYIEFCHRQFCLYSHIFWPSWFAMVHVHEMDTQSITTFYHLLASTPCLPAWLLDIWTYRITSGWVTSVQHSHTNTGSLSTILSWSWCRQEEPVFTHCNQQLLHLLLF